MEQATMGGKPREHWENVMERIKRLISNLDRMRDIALAMEDPSGEDVADRAAGDIDALIDALVVLDFDYTQHFGERPRALQAKKEEITTQ